MWSIDASSIDKSLPIPVGTQLYGLVSYILSHGDVPHGTKLPSVRQLAGDLSIAPMTVSQVFQQLREAGLVKMRPGLGVFSVRHQRRRAGDQEALAALRRDIGLLIDHAEKLGISTMALSSMITAQAQLRKPRPGLNIVFVGIFEAPARDYVAEIGPVLLPEDNIRITTLGQLKASAEARSEAGAADVVLTFLHREVEVRKAVPEARVLGIRFIPSTRTRQVLAGLPSGIRVAAVTFFEDYIAIMKPSVREFAPHVSDISVTWIAAPELQDLLQRCDAVIYATGADHVRNLVAADVPCHEFRHSPDPEAVEHVLAPHLEQLRHAKANTGAASVPGVPVASGSGEDHQTVVSTRSSTKRGMK
jgi:DNA-binding transcriptional regulator YhcF (GntR family)